MMCVSKLLVRTEEEIRTMENKIAGYNSKLAEGILLGISWCINDATDEELEGSVGDEDG